MRFRSVILAWAIASTSIAQTILVKTNEVGMGFANHTLSGPVGSFRLNVVVEEAGAGKDISDIANTSLILTVKDRGDDRVLYTITSDTAQEQDRTIGEVRWVIPSLVARDYELKAVAVPLSGTNDQYNLHWGYLNVTSSPAASSIINVYITNATYVTGGLISNVVTGTSNHWDTATGTLHINQDGCQSYTIGTTGQAYNTVWQIDDCTVLIGTNAVTTLGGYTAQQIADLERSTANFDFTVLTWATTVSVSRADGVFQYLTTAGPTYIQVPAGLTNMGYMINLDVAATTNSITFLPDNILIATNLYTYTNRTMTFLLHNPWNEETVGVYGLKRDND